MRKRQHIKYRKKWKKNYKNWPKKTYGAEKNKMFLHIYDCGEMFRQQQKINKKK